MITLNEILIDMITFKTLPQLILQLEGLGYSPTYVEGDELTDDAITVTPSVDIQIHLPTVSVVTETSDGRFIFSEELKSNKQVIEYIQS